MKPLITFIYPYYDNPAMLVHQQQNWLKYSEWIRDELDVIVVDDCSPRWALKDVPVIFPHRRYRVKVDVRWNWLMCRNLGALQAHEDSWLFLTDIDHLIPGSTVGALMAKIKEGSLNKNYYYLFARKDAPDLTDYKDHPNTYFMHRSLYWKIGGYDEYYSGNYGTDGMYRRRAEIVADGFEKLNGLYVVRYPREVIADASTTTLKRKEGRNPNLVKRMKKAKEISGDTTPITVSFPWEEIHDPS